MRIREQARIIVLEFKMFWTDHCGRLLGVQLKLNFQPKIANQSQRQSISVTGYLELMQRVRHRSHRVVPRLMQ